MRYREDQPPNLEQPYGASMHNMLDLSMVLSIIIGFALLWIARRGRVLWLSVWSIGLVLSSAGYLVYDRLGGF